MQFLNSNTIHNILNVAIAVMGGVTAFLIATGCTQDANGVLSCSQSWINPAYTAAIVSAMGVLKTVINVLRDGVGGLIKQQPPVK